MACALACALLQPIDRADTQPAVDESQSKRAISGTLVVLGFDALGMESDKVAQLETLFRMEIERLAGRPSPTPRDVDRALRRSRRLRECGGETACLAGIGKKLGVDLVVTGNIATLGDSHIMNIKVVDANQATELRRIASDPLRGDPDELIDAVRVAAYRLLAPDELKGSVLILADLDGATVTLDGQVVGKTPVSQAIDDLPLGHHTLEVKAEGYSPFAEQVLVRFQKSTRVTVSLLPDPVATGGAVLTGNAVRVIPKPAPKRWYNKTWFLVGAGVAAVVVGGYIGHRLAQEDVVDCSASPEGCR